MSTEESSKKQSSFLQCYGIRTTGMVHKWVMWAQKRSSYVKAEQSIIHLFTKSFLSWHYPELLKKKNFTAVLGCPTRLRSEVEKIA